MHPLRPCRGLPRAHPLDKRRARGRAAHLRARGVPSRRKRTAPFVREGSRRAELDPAALEPPPRTAPDDADVGEEPQRDNDEPEAAQAAELVLRDSERDRRPWQEKETQERPEERVEGADQADSGKPL